MALIKCSECESQISDKTAACPKCGAPLEKESPIVSEVFNQTAPLPVNNAPAYNSQVLKSHNKKMAVIFSIIGICIVAIIAIMIISGSGNGGGSNGNKSVYYCPKCHSTNVHAGQHNANTGIQNFNCYNCNYYWTDFDNGLRQGGYR